MTSPEAFEEASVGLPDRRPIFRQAQLLLLLEVVMQRRAITKTLDRLAYYDFFAANPYMVVSGDEARDVRDRLSLRLLAFSENQVSYNATGQRFVSRRRRIQHDMTRLVGLGLGRLSDASGWHLTSQGSEIAARLDTQYADAFRHSADLVVRRLHSLSDRAMRTNAERWLGQSWLLVDFLDDVRSIEGEADQVTSR